MDELRFDLSLSLDVGRLARMAVALSDAGEPIMAVRVVKEALGCGVRQAKDIVDVARNASRARSFLSVVEEVAVAIGVYAGI